METADDADSTTVPPKTGKGLRPPGLENAPRIDVLQRWFDSDPGPDDTIYDSESVRRFVRFELAEGKMIDESSIEKWQHWHFGMKGGAGRGPRDWLVVCHTQAAEGRHE